MVSSGDGQTANQTSRVSHILGLDKHLLAQDDQDMLLTESSRCDQVSHTDDPNLDDHLQNEQEPDELQTEEVQQDET